MDNLIKNGTLDFIRDFSKLRTKCPNCNDEQVQLLVLTTFVKGEDLGKEPPPEYYRCKCRICKHRFLKEKPHDKG